MAVGKGADPKSDVDTPLPTTGILYLASPYTDPDSQVREARYQAVTSVAAQLVLQGRVVFSPLTMTHPIDKLIAGLEGTLGSDYWIKFDEQFMACCSDMAVLMLDGWDRSLGVRREIEYFSSRMKPITYLSA
jgi:hypothetical protein